MQQRLTERRSQLAEYNASVQGYMLDHKMAVTALVAGVGGIQMSSDNAYSEDAKEFGGVVTAIAVLWALNNMDEVSDVFKTLNQADARVNTLKTDIAQTTAALQQEEQSLESSKEQFQALTRQKTGLEQELSTL
jgi:chromosome segregation ATPase